MTHDPTIEELVATANMTPPYVAPTDPAPPPSHATASTGATPPPIDDVLFALCARVPTIGKLAGDPGSASYQNALFVLAYIMSEEDALSPSSIRLAAGAIERAKSGGLGSFGRLTLLPYGLQRAITRATRKATVTAYADVGAEHVDTPTVDAFMSTAILNIVFPSTAGSAQMHEVIDALVDMNASTVGVTDEGSTLRAHYRARLRNGGEIHDIQNGEMRERALLSWVPSLRNFADGENDAHIVNGRPNSRVLRVALLAAHAIASDGIGDLKPWVPSVSGIVSDRELWRIRRVVAGEFTIRHPGEHAVMSGYVRSLASLLGLYKMAGAVSRASQGPTRRAGTDTGAIHSRMELAPAWWPNVGVREIAAPTEDIPGSYAVGLRCGTAWATEACAMRIARDGVLSVLNETGFAAEWPGDVRSAFTAMLDHGVIAAERMAIFHAGERYDALLPADMPADEIATWCDRFVLLVGMSEALRGNDPAIFGLAASTAAQRIEAPAVLGASLFGGMTWTTKKPRCSAAPFSSPSTG